MEEPYGKFGAMNPTGHAAVYFNHICADSHTVLRPCHDGEFGVVISRYHKIDGYDWIAIPLIGYLYAVDSLNDIPLTVDREKVAALRDAYRKSTCSISRRTPAGRSPQGRVDRTRRLLLRPDDPRLPGRQHAGTRPAIHGHLQRPPQRRPLQPALPQLRRLLPRRPRHLPAPRYPPQLHRRRRPDDAQTSGPLAGRIRQEEPRAQHVAFVIPQVPGSIPRSHPVDGVAESLVKSKKYLLPLVVLAPEVTGGVVVAYLVDGRLKLPKGTPVFDIGDEETTSSSDTRPKASRSSARQNPRILSSGATALIVFPCSNESRSWAISGIMGSSVQSRTQIRDFGHRCPDPGPSRLA